MRRPATPADAEQVFAIYMHDAVAPYLSFDPMPMESFRTVYQDLLHGNSLFVFELSGRVAGFYTASRYSGRTQHVACLGTLAVDPALNGRGVGSAMVKDAVAWLHASGVRRIELFVETDNSRALRFYKRLGFEVEGTLRQYYKRASDTHYVDEYVMALLLE